MRNWLLDILACPFCRGDVQAEEPSSSQYGDLWFLRCGGCRIEFPVFLDRPILVPKGVEGWLSAIDQAAGWADSPRAAIVSLAWLGQELDSGKDPEDLVRWRSMPWTGRSRGDWVEVLENVRKDAEARRNGKWFEESDRRRRMLESPLLPIPRPEERSILDEFAERVVRAKPLRLLDIASGGGFAVTRILAHMKEAEYVVAVEKDLKCLWTIQYRAEYIARQREIGETGVRFEAVGADARRLPFRDESFDFASTYHSLGEICGIKDILLQVHRVLEPRGKFQLSFHDTELANYVPSRR